MPVRIVPTDVIAGLEAPSGVRYFLNKGLLFL